MQVKTKLAVVVRNDLAMWQRLNVAAFSMGGVGTRHPHLIGEDYEDASGVRYLPMPVQPVVVYQADAEQIRAAHRRAVDRGLDVAVYTEDMFLTGNDVDNRAVVLAVPTEKLALAGFSVYGGRNAVDKALKGLSLHS